MTTQRNAAGGKKTEKEKLLTIMADDKDVAEKTIAEDLVVTKYKMAGEIVNSECPPAIRSSLRNSRKRCCDNLATTIWSSRPVPCRRPCGRKCFVSIVASNHAVF